MADYSSRGRHYADCLDGRVFSQATTPLGKALPIYTATDLTDALMVWNPSGSGVVVELMRCEIAYAGTGAAAADYGAVGLIVQNIRQSNALTGAQLAAFASTTPKNGLLFGGRTSRILSTNLGTNTLTTAAAAGDWVRSLFSTNLEANTGTAHGTILAIHDFKGTCLIPGGALAWIAAARAATAGLFTVSLSWKEIYA